MHKSLMTFNVLLTNAAKKVFGRDCKLQYPDCECQPTPTTRKQPIPESCKANSKKLSLKRICFKSRIIFIESDEVCEKCFYLVYKEKLLRREWYSRHVTVSCGNYTGMHNVLLHSHDCLSFQNKFHCHINYFKITNSTHDL